MCEKEREREREMPPSRCRKKKSSVIEHSPMLRLRLRQLPLRKSSSSNTKGALADGESLLCRGSSSFLPSFLPSCHFLTMYFPLLVSRANNGERELGGRGGERKKHEEKGVDSAHPLLIYRLSLRFAIYTFKTMGKAKKGRKTEE